MLSITQNVIVALLLFAVLHPPSPVGGDIVAYSADGGNRSFDGLSALFGDPLPRDGQKGFLVVARPENACEPVAPPPHNRTDDGGDDFVALVERSGDCGFAAQVLNAQRAGYAAAVVHDVNSTSPGALVRMGYAWDVSTWMRIRIPAVFVSGETAHSLKRHYTHDKGGHVVLTADALQERMVAVLNEIVGCHCLLGTVIIATVCLISVGMALKNMPLLHPVALMSMSLGLIVTCWVWNSWGLALYPICIWLLYVTVTIWNAGLQSDTSSQTRRLTCNLIIILLMNFTMLGLWVARAHGWLSELVWTALSMLVLDLVILVLFRTFWKMFVDAWRRRELREKRSRKFQTGDPYDVCSICLTEYQEGDGLRVLPCSHAYHSRCLDPWLSGMKKTTCPLCGQKVDNQEVALP